MRGAWLAVGLVLGACGTAPPTEPGDVDLATARASFRCGASGADAEACRVLAAFDAAGPLRDLPTGSETATWLGVEHCAQPSATPDDDVYAMVLLRAGTGSPPSSAIDPSRIAPIAAVFASNQLQRASAPNAAAALRAYATGHMPDPATPPEMPLFADGDGAYRTLVRTLSGRSIGDGAAHEGIWFLRGDGTHLYLVGPTIQGGCASELFRVPR